MALSFVLLRAYFWLNPIQWEYHSEAMVEVSHMNETKIDRKDWVCTFASWQMFRREARSICIDMFKTAKLSGPAVDVDVITLEGNAAKLLDYSSDPDRPLVVNFGSCT